MTVDTAAMRLLSVAPFDEVSGSSSHAYGGLSCSYSQACANRELARQSLRSAAGEIDDLRELVKEYEGRDNTVWSRLQEVADSLHELATKVLDDERAAHAATKARLDEEQKRRWSAEEALHSLLDSNGEKPGKAITHFARFKPGGGT